jgi:hypothetical protein
LRFSLAPYALGALLAATATAGDARANPRSPEVLKALEALREKRFEDALTACAPGPSSEIQPECPLLRAHALHALGKHLAAYEALRALGVERSEEANSAPVDRETFRSVLLGYLARVSIVCSVEGPAQVWVNGKLAKTCPTSAPVVTEAGEIVIEVIKEGFEAYKITVPGTPGGTVTARVNLVRANASSPAPTTEPKEQNAAAPEAAQDAIQEPTQTKSGATAAKKRTTTDSPPDATTASSSRPSFSSGSSRSSSSGGGSSIGKDEKYVLLTLGVIAALGISVGLIAALTSGPASKPTPASTGSIPPGQVEVPPLVAW